MQAKKVAAAGFIAAAAGAGAWFLFSKRMAPTRKALGQKIKRTTRTVAEKVEAATHHAA